MSRHLTLRLYKIKTIFMLFQLQLDQQWTTFITLKESLQLLNVTKNWSTSSCHTSLNYKIWLRSLKKLKMQSMRLKNSFKKCQKVHKKVNFKVSKRTFVLIFNYIALVSIRHGLTYQHSLLVLLNMAMLTIAK